MTTMVSNELIFSALPEFPEDVVFEILLRLPVESILRFKCVSKSWYSFLSCPGFIAKHLSIQSENHLFITTRCEETDHVTAYSISDIDDVDTHIELDMLSPYMNHNYAYGDQQIWRINGPCNGLIVISDDTDGDVIICNIATRNFRMLPKSSFYPFPKNDANLFFDPFHAYIRFVGIGYDSNMNDYKVLRVLLFWDDIYQEIELPPRAEVFSIGTDTCWRKINMTNVPNFSDVQYGTYLDGSLYFMTCYCSILWSFNVVDERFRNISLPERNDAHEFDVLVPTVYNKEFALCVLRYSSESEQLIDVWVMKEFGTEQSWCKLSTFRLIHRPGGIAMTFWKNSELLYGDTTVRLIVYDLGKMECKIISLKDEEYCLVLVPYMKTLVCINKWK